MKRFFGHLLHLCFLFARNKLPTWNPLAQAVALYIGECDGDDLMDYIRSIMRLFLQWKMVNINVISYRPNSNVIQSHTFYPYDDGNCANNVEQLSLIEECEYSDETPFDPMFSDMEMRRPKIPNDLHGCELRMAASVMEPFVFYDSETNDFPTGTEVLMTRTIAEALKMRPVFRHINETRENRVVSNETGIYSLLLRQ